jgi:serine/threonine-protein kinase
MGPTFGRYTMLGEIASGGLATIYLGRFTGEMGFSRTVAIKELRPAFARDPAFVSMLTDEARVGAQLRHPNLVATLDVVVTESSTLLVLDYVHGEALAPLLEAAHERGERVPVPVVVAIASGALRGLHEAHSARDGAGRSLEIVHRDLSPQNILVGTDGIARVADFGIAKARGRVTTTETGVIKGKAAYMAPEQVHGSVTSRSDLFAMAVVAWEALAGEPLFVGASASEVMAKVLAGKIRRLTAVRPDVPEAVAAIIHEGLARDPARRPVSALDMAERLEAAAAPASVVEVGEWVSALARATIESRAALLAGGPAARPGRPATILSTELVTETIRADPGPRRWLRRNVALAATLAAVGLAALGGWLAFSRSRPTAVASASGGPGAGASSGSPEPEPSAVDSSDAPPFASSVAGGPASTAPAHRPTHAGSRCSPPYVVDALGHIKYKRECFGR